MSETMMRDATDAQEILRLLQEAQVRKAPFQAWQNQGEERLVHEVVIKEVDEHNQLLLLQHPHKEELPFTDESELFLRQEELNILFRVVPTPVSKKLLEAPVPAVMKVPDRRGERRQLFTPTQQAPGGEELVISVFSQVDQTPKELAVDLFDLSRSGAGLRIRQKMLKHIQGAQELQVLSYRGQALERPWKARIVYLHSFEEARKLHSSVFYRAGLRFEEAFPLGDL